jgi:hypothetical protein
MLFGAVIVASATGLIPTDLDAVLWQLLGFTSVMPSCTVPEAPAEYWMDEVPWPEVMLPPVMVHVNVEPAPGFTTDALLPVLLAQTDAAAVIVASEGTQFTGMDFELDAVQPAAVVTVTFRTTLPEVPEVKVMELDPAPAVIVPLVIDHE